MSTEVVSLPVELVCNDLGVRPEIAKIRETCEECGGTGFFVDSDTGDKVLCGNCSMASFGGEARLPYWIAESAGLLHLVVPYGSAQGEGRHVVNFLCPSCDKLTPAKSEEEQDAKQTD